MPQKHHLEPTSSGPYQAERRSTYSSVQLRDPATGELVAKGADIPLEQILTGPRRSLLKFEESGHDRSIGDMIEGRLPGVQGGVVATGLKASKTRMDWPGKGKRDCLQNRCH